MSVINKLLEQEQGFTIRQVRLRGETARRFQAFVKITKLSPEIVAAAIVDDVVTNNNDFDSVIRGKKVGSWTAGKKAPAGTPRKRSEVQRWAAQVAASRRTVVGKVYKEFSTKHAKQIKKWTPDEVKAARNAWLKKEASRASGKK